MSSPSQTQQRVLPVPLRPYACRFLGCPKKYIYSTDATRHYDEKHNLQLAASCPISGCMKIISDARKSDKQKEHMRRKHPDEDGKFDHLSLGKQNIDTLPVEQAWVKVAEFQQPVNSGMFMTGSKRICQQRDEDQVPSIGTEDAKNSWPCTQRSSYRGW